MRSPVPTRYTHAARYTTDYDADDANNDDDYDTEDVHVYESMHRRGAGRGYKDYRYEDSTPNVLITADVLENYSATFLTTTSTNTPTTTPHRAITTGVVGGLGVVCGWLCLRGQPIHSLQ